MLKRLPLALGVLLIVALAPVTRMAFAETCSTSVANGDTYASSISVAVTCQTQSAGSSGTAGSTTGGGGSAPDRVGCYDSNGAQVQCWIGSYWWSAALNMYCIRADFASNSNWWIGHLDDRGNPTGGYYFCRNAGEGVSAIIPVWVADPLSTPDLPGVDPEALVRTALAELGLHPPTVGVGAYIYPGYEDWGLSWWVGAPMWLWIDTSDPLQWGSHTLTASESGTSVTATVTPTSVTYSTGDGGTETCTTGGTYRPWNPNDLLSHHSPSGCEHTYMTINTKGDRTSRFTVTATVLWTITWTATTGQAGSFTTTLESTSSASIHVGELHVVTIPNP